MLRLVQRRPAFGRHHQGSEAGCHRPFGAPKFHPELFEVQSEARGEVAALILESGPPAAALHENGRLHPCPSTHSAV